jgi:signal transduction histidine kinase
MPFILRHFSAVLVLLIASFAGCVLPAQPSAELPVLRAVYGDFYPYTFKGEDGAAQGYSIDVTRLLAKTAGYDVEFVAAENPQQFLQMLERGEVDLTPFLALTAERRAAGLATSELGQYVLSIYLREDHPVKMMEMLKGRRIGVVVGSISHAAAELLADVEIVEYQTSDDLLLPLLSGELDAVAAVAETFEARLRSNFLSDNVRALPRPLMIIPYGIIIQRDQPEVHAAFERAIDQPASPAALATLRDTWFGQDRSIIEHPWFHNVAMIVGGTALTTFALGFYAVRLRRRSARLLLENGANQLLIDAFDKMRAAIVIFDSEMRAKHWNSGFEARFADILPELRDAAALVDVCRHFSDRVAEQDGSSPGRGGDFAPPAAARLRDGHTDQRIVQTGDGSSFDLSMFPLGTSYFAAIWVDVTELQRQQEHIACQGQELARKNQQLMAFSAMAAHDLKAPLMQQRALVEFIAEDIADAQMKLPAGVVGHFAMLSDLSGHMSLLVSDLLDFAKADVEQNNAQVFSPNGRLENILKLAAPSPDIVFDIMPDMPRIRVEPTCFDMVMRNLVTNAIKHHDRQNGKITVRAYENDLQVVIEIEDDGPGIPSNYQARIFEPFARLTKVEGTGLGLAFVRKTVSAWGGTVHVRAAPERGCIFSVTVPVAKDNVVAMTFEKPLVVRQPQRGTV